jgi:hypothetical protein
MGIQTLVDKKQYLPKKVDFFVTYISDFCVESGRELNSLQTYAVVEERRMNLAEGISDAKLSTLKQYLARNSIC